MENSGIMQSQLLKLVMIVGMSTLQILLPVALVLHIIVRSVLDRMTAIILTAVFSAVDSQEKSSLIYLVSVRQAIVWLGGLIQATYR